MVLPSFPQILKKLSPSEAKTLDTIYKEDEDEVESENWDKNVWVRSHDIRDIMRESGVRARDFNVTIHNLERLGLCVTGKIRDDYHDESRSTMMLHDNYIFANPFGLAFASACRYNPNEKSRKAVQKK